MQPRFNESTSEEAALAWLESLGCARAFGPDLAPDGSCAERNDYAQVVLTRRLRDALLPELISGRLRVADAEKFLQARGL